VKDMQKEKNFVKINVITISFPALFLP